MSTPTGFYTFERLKIEILADAGAIAAKAAGMVVQTLERKADAVICVATGASPAATYERLAAVAAARPELFAAVRIVELDEWLGLPPGHASTCDAYLRQRVIGPLGISPERYLHFDASAASPEEECARVTQALAAWGGIDLALLGIGVNGHIGLNEPGSDPRLLAQVSTLAASSQRHSMLAGPGGGDVHITRGLTLGLGELVRARRVLVLVMGAAKASGLRNMTAASVSECPAACFRGHDDATVLCDTQAAALVERC